jgi:hypothetical protein
MDTDTERALADNLNLPQQGRKCAFSLLKDAFPGGFPSVNIIPTTETETEGMIYSLKSKTHQVMMKYQTKF